MSDLNISLLKKEIDYLLENTKNYPVEKNVEMKNILSKKVPYLFKRSYTLFSKIINKEDMTELPIFLEKIQKIKNKETDIKKESETVGQIMFDKYIKDKLPEKN